ncbi:MAG: hypothetical protein KGI89_03010 [Euryarchaeota archaeon]|nr:hypothetical protein [Euryarchaeota archaeon]
MWIEFATWEAFEKWANALNNVEERFVLLTDVDVNRGANGTYTVILRPVRGGGLDTGQVKFRADAKAVEGIETSQLFNRFHAVGRKLSITDYVVRET